MNLDVQPYRVPSSDWIDAYNITRDAQGDMQDDVVSNILGNTLISYTKPAGVNKRIGSYEDKTTNRVYAFFWNSNNKHYINYFDKTLSINVKVMENLTDTGNLDVLGFNPSYRINHIDIIHRTQGDLMYWTDGLNPPSKINVLLATTAGYGVITRSFLDVAKDMPLDCPQVTYENDNNVTVNNLKNSLFQFAQCWGFNDFEYSAYSTATIVPLPFMPQDPTTDTDATKNSRIAVYVFTGDSSVKKIRIAFKQTKNGATTGYFQLDDLVKADLGIADNTVYRYLFYNNDVPIPVDPKLGARIFDWVPQTAISQAFANGNTPVYGSIKEGYDLFTPSVASSVSSGVLPYNLYNGVLFFGTQDSPTQITIYLTGMGTNNGSNNPSGLGNMPGTLYVHAKTPVGVGVNFTINTSGSFIGTNLTALGVAAVAQGFTVVSTADNSITLNLVGGVVLGSEGVLRTSGTFNVNDVIFCYAPLANYQFGVVYFDEKGRTNQVITAAGFKVKTGASGIPIITLQISHRPPLWAKEYHFVRSNDLTYNKRFYWVSNSAYSQFSNTTNLTYAYIGYENVDDYNLSISATTPVVGYEFSPGDRITFNTRILFNGTTVALSGKDYPILGVENDVLIGGVKKPGRYIKILYPAADISSDFKFDGTFDFQNYQIFVYNYKEHTADGLNVYYEFGKNFPIGNPGTANAYHYCQNQTQTADLVTPASIDLTEGDYFYRQRTVPIGGAYYYNMAGYENGLGDSTLIPIQVVPTTPFTTPYYQFATEIYRVGDIVPGDEPTDSGTDCIFQNTFSSPIRLRMRCSMSFTNDVILTQFSILTKQVTASTTTSQIIFPNLGGLTPNITHDIEIDNVITVQPTEKVFLIMLKSGSKVWVQSSTWRFDVLNNFPIDIIENSFSDTYAIRTNSNSRPFIIDKDAKQTFFPALVRFGLEFDQDTNINQTNVFYYENSDTYDRSFGNIMKMFIRGRRLFIFQQYETGVVPVLTQIVRDTKDNPLEANSDILLNKITYPYEGQWGIGDYAASFAFAKGNIYFGTYKNVPCRLGQDGIIPLSILYDTNAYFVKQLEAYKNELNNGLPANSGVPYTGNPTVYGVFDQYTNKYILALEQIDRYVAPPAIISFIIRVSLSEQIFFYGALTAGVTMDLILTATNGDSQLVTYTIVPGETTDSLRNAFINLINTTVGTLFNAGTVSVTTPAFGITGVPDGTTLFGLSVSDNAGFGVTASFVVVNQLVFNQDPATLCFLEARQEKEGFESRYAYAPEGMTTIGNLLLSYKNGDVYRHDSDTYCNFYGVQYEASITVIFNDHSLQKKTWKTLTELAGQIWDCPEISSQMVSYGSTPQQSNLINTDFEVLENNFHAAFLNDSNSIGGIGDGDNLKGNYLTVKFRVTNASNLVFLNGAIVRYIDSPLTTK